MGTIDLLNTIALLIPGYFGAWAMSFIIGVRKREWAQMTLYSLFFAAISYFVVLRAMPLINEYLIESTGLNLTGLQRALNQISNIGVKDSIVELHNTVKVVVSVSLVSLILGLLAGGIRMSAPVKNFFRNYLKRTQNIDIWSDYHDTYRVGPHYVHLKDGFTLYGYIELASDTLTGNDRGIIMSQAYMTKNILHSDITGEPIKGMQMPGNVLVLMEQIAFISDSHAQINVAQQTPHPPSIP